MVETVIEDGTKIEVFTMNETENLCASFFYLTMPEQLHSASLNKKYKLSSLPGMDPWSLSVLLKIYIPNGFYMSSSSTKWGEWHKSQPESILLIDAKRLGPRYKTCTARLCLCHTVMSPLIQFCSREHNEYAFLLPLHRTVKKNNNNNCCVPTRVLTGYPGWY